MARDQQPMLTGRRLLWPALTVVFIIGLILAYIFLSDGEKEETPTRVEPVVEQPQVDKQPEIAAPVVPSFDIVRLSPSGTGVVAGRAAPRTEVILYADGKEVARARSDARGEWVMILETALPPGPTEFSVEAVQDDGTHIVSSDIVIVAVPEPDEVAKGQGVLAVLSPRDGVGVSRALQVPSNGLAQDLAAGIRIETVDIGKEGEASFSGVGEPGVELRLYIDNVYQGSVVPGEDGFWSLMVTDLGAAEAKERKLRVDQVVADGQVILRVEQSYDPMTGANLGKAQRAVEVQSGNNLWAIARNLYGAGWRYVYIFQANAAQIRDPDLIYPGQLFTLPEDGESDSVGEN